MTAANGSSKWQQQQQQQQVAAAPAAAASAAEGSCEVIAVNNMHNLQPAAAQLSCCDLPQRCGCTCSWNGYSEWYGREFILLVYSVGVAPILQAYQQR